MFKSKKIKNCTFNALLPPRNFWHDKHYKNIDLKFKNYKNMNILIKKFNKSYVLNFYKKIDVLISPSLEIGNYMEQDGQVLLESLSCQNVAISSNVGFFKDIKTTKAFFKINKVNSNSIYNIVFYVNKNFNMIKKYRFENRLLVEKNFSLKPVNNKKIYLLNKI